jgi:deazaflavin-dependent oxidoreductase (nitroreductase family)
VDREARAKLEDWNRTVIEEFRSSGGRNGGPYEDVSLLLLHTRGARSGIERVNPLAHLEDEGRLFVFASNAGADTDPDWYANLVAHPQVTVELGTETFPATAVILEGAARDRVFALQKARHPGFADYEAKTSRVIPVVELQRS